MGVGGGRSKNEVVGAKERQCNAMQCDASITRTSTISLGDEFFSRFSGEIRL